MFFQSVTSLTAHHCTTSTSDEHGTAWNFTTHSYKKRKSDGERSIDIMDSNKTNGSVSFKVFLNNLNNDSEVRRFVMDSDAATSITRLQVCRVKFLEFLQSFMITHTCQFGAWFWPPAQRNIGIKRN